MTSADASNRFTPGGKEASPRTTDDGMECNEVLVNQRPPMTPNSEFRQHKIVVVDDNRDAADSLAVLLRLMGQNVSVAYDGKNALELIATTEPHYVFLDLGMPEMDGYEVARRVRANPAYAKLIIIALTGWGQQEDRQRTAEAGFDRHFVKPLEPDVLRDLLKN